MFRRNYPLDDKIAKPMTTFIGSCVFIALGLMAHASFFNLLNFVGWAWALFLTGVLLCLCAVFLFVINVVLEIIADDIGLKTRYVFNGITCTSILVFLTGAFAVVATVSILIAGGLITVFVDDYPWAVRFIALSGAGLYFTLLCLKIADFLHLKFWI